MDGHFGAGEQRMKHQSTQATYRPIIRPLYTAPDTTCPVQVDLEDLPALGWVRIVDQGDENTYCETGDGVLRYFKA